MSHLLLGILLTLFFVPFVESCPQGCHCSAMSAKCANLPTHVAMERTLSEMPENITRLDLSKNGLTSFKARLLSNLTRLKVLYLNENKLTQLPQNLSVHVPTLRKLYMSDNYLLKSLSRQSLETAFNLEKIYLRDSGILRLKADDFYNNTALLHLNIQHNRIRRIDVNAFTGLRRLRFLHLDNNIIRELPKHVFNQLINLNKMSVSSNSISSIPNHLFAQNRQLKIIALNTNLINHLGSASFQDIGNLTNIYLQNNLIRNFSSDTFQGTHISDSINLNENPLHCDCYLTSLKLKWLRVDGKIKGHCSNPPELTGRPIAWITRKELNCTECDFNGCQNNATCVIEADQYNCVCTAGFEGGLCETPISVRLKKESDLGWIVTTVVCIFVVVLGVIFAVWYYRKRKGRELCTQKQCCCCFFAVGGIGVIGVFVIVQFVSLMYEEDSHV
eukprot:TCONS_00005536-protein